MTVSRLGLDLTNEDPPAHRVLAQGAGEPRAWHHRRLICRSLFFATRRPRCLNPCLKARRFCVIRVSCSVDHFGEPPKHRTDERHHLRLPQPCTSFRRRKLRLAVVRCARLSAALSSCTEVWLGCWEDYPIGSLSLFGYIPVHGLGSQWSTRSQRTWESCASCVSA